MGCRLICTGSDDWTDQELVEFYRVEASLVQANIPIETDRGRSDGAILGLYSAMRIQVRSFSILLALMGPLSRPALL